MLSARRWRTLKGADMKVLMVASVIAFEVGTFGVANADEALRREATALFGQVKASTEAASPQVELGRALFWDTRLSADGKTACPSCHRAGQRGADRPRFCPDAAGAVTCG